MTEEEIRAALARAEAATPGPWHRTADHQIVQTAHLMRDVWTIPRTEEDVEFLAHARTDVPALAAECLRLRAALARFESTVDDVVGDMDCVCDPYGTDAHVPTLCGACELRAACKAAKEALRE